MAEFKGRQHGVDPSNLERRTEAALRESSGRETDCNEPVERLLCPSSRAGQWLASEISLNAISFHREGLLSKRST